jgi:hypothetical protein
LTAIVVGFIYLTSTQLKGSGYDVASQKALWLAEAGIEKAIWYLKTAPASGGYGENWTTTDPLTESLGDGSYTLEVAAWDFALATNGAFASDSPTGTNPTFVNDNNDSTYWESNGVPSTTTQIITIQFPYPISINNASFVVPTGGNAPNLFTFDVFTPATSSWTTVRNIRTTTKFLVKSGVTQLRLSITAGLTADQKVRVASINTTGMKITSTGTVSGVSRTIVQTVVVKQTTQTGYGYAEPDWNEIY